MHRRLARAGATLESRVLLGALVQPMATAALDRRCLAKLEGLVQQGRGPRLCRVGSRGSSHVVLVVRPVMLAPAGAWQHNGNDWHVERSSQGSQDEGSLASEMATNMRLVLP